MEIIVASNTEIMKPTLHEEFKQILLAMDSMQMNESNLYIKRLKKQLQKSERFSLPVHCTTTYRKMKALQECLRKLTDLYNVYQKLLEYIQREDACK